MDVRLHGLISAALALIITLGLAGCTSYRAVESQDSKLLYDIAVGDKVKIKTHAGEWHEFQVIEVTENSIVGSDIEIDVGEIASITKKDFDAELTTAAVGTTALVGYMVYVTIAVIAGLAALAAI